VGSDEQYLGINGYKIDQGRNLDRNDMENSLNVVVLGQEIAASFSNALTLSIRKSLLWEASTK
jgi:hypothetical protein